MLMVDPKIFPRARVGAIIGLPSFLFNEFSWNPSQWFDVKISRVLGVIFSNRCFLFFFRALCVQFLHFLVACLLDFQ